ncbi:peptidylprolyl isomerase [Thalassotalea aquiviva]|uniref:peptidylprolyl isomerase n=1 Tax=Thalassotalea aquiviva TaxID=3242415 RepID=UPI00352A19DA
MKLSRFSAITSLLLLAFAWTHSAQATIVLFKTSQGDFEVNLLDNHTPETVENFLQYVNEQAYNNTIIHRSVDGFITQGGGFVFNQEDNKLENVESHDPVVNEPVFSNVRGTIAMAKLGGKENSATNQWFFNMDDNSGNLDYQNGGFTVFGVVDEQGMEIIDAINNLKTYNLGGALAALPLQTEPAEDEKITNEHLVMIESVTVVNSNVDTQPELPPMTSDTNEDKDSSGGSLNFWLLAGLFTLAFTRVKK